MKHKILSGFNEVRKQKPTVEQLQNKIAEENL